MRLEEQCNHGWQGQSWTLKPSISTRKYYSTTFRVGQPPSSLKLIQNEFDITKASANKYRLACTSKTNYHSHSSQPSNNKQYQQNERAGYHQPKLPASPRGTCIVCIIRNRRSRLQKCQNTKSHKTGCSPATLLL